MLLKEPNSSPVQIQQVKYISKNTQYQHPSRWPEIWADMHKDIRKTQNTGERHWYKRGNPCFVNWWRIIFWNISGRLFSSGIVQESPTWIWWVNEVCDVRPAEAELLQTANAFSIGGLCRWCRSQILCHWYNLSLASGTEPEMHYISFCILHSMPVPLTIGTCATPQMFCYGCHCFCVRTRQRIPTPTELPWAFWTVCWKWLSSAVLCQELPGESASRIFITLHSIKCRGQLQVRHHRKILGASASFLPTARVNVFPLEHLQSGGV